ncbi:hypothetical protein ABD87_22865 [Lysinibacillus sphaericus]|uniref:hypothetical protein n=1 Tax=Lysinibacillus sphaericus TaxID=1421 RepID=UPI0018CD3861|nr:hypothetical protein [Lysinibacillus sphaericus]MBG9732270.1 hypothetical protein [Lysinibacillus sphaericus]
MPIEINVETLPCHIKQIATIEIVNQLFVSDALYDKQRNNLSVFQWLGNVKQGEYLIFQSTNSLIIINNKALHKKPLSLPFKDVVRNERHFIAVDSKTLYLGEYKAVHEDFKLGSGVHITNIPEGIYPLIQISSEYQIVGLQIYFQTDDSH